MTTSFQSLPISDALQQSISSLGFTEMTEIQQQSLPVILSGKDVLGKAKTGSGKTVTFALGLLNKVKVEHYAVQGLVMCPTRELAEQVAQEIRQLGRTIDNLKVLTLCGGTPMGPQISSLAHGAHVIVGTPGRIMDHLLKRRLDLRNVHTFILDEADRMLDMGFEDEMEVVTKHIPTERQTLLFSATYPDSIKQISMKVQRNPVRIEVASTHDTSKIEQLFFEVEPQHKINATAALISHYQPRSCIVFCNTKVATTEVTEGLTELGISALALNGDLEQRERTQVLTRFANKSVTVLVATDVAARGLDVKDVDVVINYHVSDDPEVHVHRVGRTGRADATGQAFTLCAADEVKKVNGLEDYLETKFTWKGVAAYRYHANRIREPEFVTLAIDGGKKSKLRPGDILGALTKDADIPGDDIGKINITANHSYVAIKTRSVKRSLKQFREGKIKGRKFKARKLA